MLASLGANYAIPALGKVLFSFRTGERLQGGFFYSGCLYVVVGTCVEKVETGASPV